MEQRRYTPPQERNVTRRNFLRIMGGITGVNLVASAGILAGRYYQEHQSALSNLDPNSDSNLRAIEDRRGVRLTTLTLEETDALQAQYPDIIPYAWDTDRALMIDQFLPFLPDFFYAPNKLGKVHFSLVAEEKDCECEASYIVPYNLIILDPAEFSMQDMVNSFEILTHELVHYTTQDTYTHDSPDIDQILGGTFDQVREEYLQRLSTIHLPYLPEMRGFPGYLAYGLSKEYPSEFVPVLSQFYTHGRDIFDEYMSAVFEPKRADDLYVYIGDTIFRGQEFPHFPIVVR